MGGRCRNVSPAVASKKSKGKARGDTATWGWFAVKEGVRLSTAHYSIRSWRCYLVLPFAPVAWVEEVMEKHEAHPGSFVERDILQAASLNGRNRVRPVDLRPDSQLFLNELCRPFCRDPSPTRVGPAARKLLTRAPGCLFPPQRFIPRANCRRTCLLVGVSVYTPPPGRKM